MTSVQSTIQKKKRGEAKKMQISNLERDTNNISHKRIFLIQI